MPDCDKNIYKFYQSYQSINIPNHIKIFGTVTSPISVAADKECKKKVFHLLLQDFLLR